MDYVLEDIRPLKKRPASEQGGRPTYWHDEVPAMYGCMLRHKLNEKEMAELLAIPPSTFKSWILNKDAMKRVKQDNDSAETGLIHRDDPEASYEEHLEAGQVEAIRALRRIMTSGKSDAAIVSAANAVLDRAKGKPVQTNVVNRHSTYTIVSAIEAPPNSLVKQQP